MVGAWWAVRGGRRAFLHGGVPFSIHWRRAYLTWQVPRDRVKVYVTAEMAERAAQKEERDAQKAAERAAQEAARALARDEKARRAAPPAEPASVRPDKLLSHSRLPARSEQPSRPRRAPRLAKRAVTCRMRQAAAKAAHKEMVRQEARAAAAAERQAKRQARIDASTDVLKRRCANSFSLPWPVAAASGAAWSSRKAPRKRPLRFASESAGGARPLAPPHPPKSKPASCRLGAPVC